MCPAGAHATTRCYALPCATHSRHARTTFTCNGHRPFHGACIYSEMDDTRIHGSRYHHSECHLHLMVWMHHAMPSYNHALHSTTCSSLYAAIALLHTSLSTCTSNHPGVLPSWDPPCRYPSHALPQTIASWMHGLGVSIHLLLACITPWPCSGPCGTTCNAHAFCSCTHIITAAHMVSRVSTHGSIMASVISVSPYPWYGDSWYPRSP